MDWNAVSAGATALTALIALLALFSWKNQEKLKVKLEFKNAVSAYAYCLTGFPLQLNTPLIRSKFSKRCQELADLNAKAGYAWFATENLLESDEPVTRAWQQLNNLHEGFLIGEVEKESILEQCSIIIVYPFVFPTWKQRVSKGLAICRRWRKGK
ncbi:hypothetical protein D3C75_563030 [compost metagenome]